MQRHTFHAVCFFWNKQAHMALSKATVVISLKIIFYYDFQVHAIRWIGYLHTVSHFSLTECYRQNAVTYKPLKKTCQCIF